MSFFKKKTVDNRVIVGITDIELMQAIKTIEAKYDEAHARQKSPDAKPSEYMRGLSDALVVLDELQPRAL